MFVKSLLRDEQKRAKWLRKTHGFLAIAWFAMIPVSVLTSLKASVPYLIAISVYALAIGHFSSWMGGRAETKDD